MAEQAKKAKRGRPNKKIDPEQVRALARIGATYEEIADVLQIGRSTFTLKLKKQKGLREAYEQGLSEGDVSLRRAQHQAAMNGKTAMLIWLGKQRLNQAERVEVKERPSDTAKEFHEAIQRIDETLKSADK